MRIHSGGLRGPSVVWQTKSPCIFQDARDLANCLILIPEKLQCTAACHGIKRSGFEGKRQRAPTDVINISEALFAGKAHSAFEHLCRKIEANNNGFRGKTSNTPGEGARTASE